MGKSYTYHVVGQFTGGDIPKRAYQEVGAMSRKEMAQVVHKMAKDGKRPFLWWAQTKVGVKMLGNDLMAESVGVPHSMIARLLPKLAECDICGGKGCIICKYSGICQPNDKNKWMPWQIESMRQEYAA